MMILDITEPGATRAPAETNHVAVGIDLGTTHSLVAIAKDGVVEVIESAEGKLLLPSALSEGKVGYAALAARGKGDVLSSLKRFMGKTLKDTQLPEGVNARTNKDGLPEFRLGKEWLTAVDFSGRILGALKGQAEMHSGKKVEKAVITVPAYFDDAARAATKDAAKQAGLEVLRLINEPTAAALAYGLDNAAEGIYAIYDFGGGTFDISILLMQKGVFQVLSTAGDTALGGDDIDAAIAAKLNIPHHEARKFKEELKDKAVVEAAAKPLIDRTIAIAKRAVSDAGIEISEIEEVVLVGGSTRMQLVKDSVSKFFGKTALDKVDPDKVVAMGAAIQAEALTRGGDTLLLDVTPLSLGLETYGGLIEKIIPRNTPIPVAQAQEFTTYADGQTGMKVHVLQGERELASQCRSLAFFDLAGIPPMKAGIPKIRVTFAVDADGLLTVSAEELTTGKKQEVAVKPTYGLGDGDIENMLRDSYENAREDISLKLLTETRVEAETMLKNLKAALAEDGDLLSQAEREEIDTQAEALLKAMKEDDRDAIDLLMRAVDGTAQIFAERRMDRAIGKTLKGKNIHMAEKIL